MGAEAALLRLAESVADGSPVDWPAAEAAANDQQRGVIVQLRVLSELAIVHRSLPLDPRDLPGGLRSTRAAGQPAIGKWAHLALLGRIGGGTFGDVYRAWDEHLEREVALKLLKIDGSLGDPEASLITREGRLLARVRHQNVITVHGVAVEGDRVGLWMELIRGVSLEEQLERQGPLSAREATLIGIDMCRALAAIHAAGLIHRDIKAQNVMREDGGRLVLMDFGTGRELSDGPQSVSDLAGTPLYIAPEIFQGGSAGIQTDIYSLGVLLYHLVTGSFPVRAATVEELGNAHGWGKRTRLRDLRADLPSRFVQVVDRAIASDPQVRYQTAGDLEADLVQALDQGAAVPEKRVGMGALAGMAAGVLLLASLSWALWTRGAHPSAAVPPGIRSIAVLPLANLSKDPDQAYFADGITEQLIATLGEIEGLKVISRTSVMRFKGSSASLADIAKALGVETVLEGSVLVLPEPGGPDGPPGKRIRINARLIYAGTDTSLWNRTFERRGADAFALQDEIARAVADGIDLRSQFMTRVLANKAQDFDVFDLYLRGRYYWNMRTEEGFRRSIQYFQEAINRDPRYAPAHAGLADAYNLLGVYGYLPRSQSIPRAREAARAALDLDEGLAEAHASLGHIQANELEGQAAEASFRRAIELKPGYASVHHWYADFLAQRERFSEALAEIERALILDPLSVGVQGEKGAILVFARRYPEAVGPLREALRLDSSIAQVHFVLSMALAGDAKSDEALSEAERALSLDNRNPDFHAQLARILVNTHRRDEAVAILEKLVEGYRLGDHAEPAPIAMLYAVLGDNDAAFRWLDQARQARDPWLGYLRVASGFDNVRTDPRFGSLLESVGLAP